MVSVRARVPLTERPSYRVRVTYRVHGIAEVGDVQDPGGNAALAAIADNSPYVRVGPRVKVSVLPYAISKGLRFWGDYTHRFTLTEGEGGSYFEAGFAQDIALDGALQLTGIYRVGERAPAFTDVHSVVLGVGLQIK